MCPLWQPEDEQPRRARSSAPCRGPQDQPYAPYPGVRCPTLLILPSAAIDIATEIQPKTPPPSWCAQPVPFAALTTRCSCPPSRTVSNSTISMRTPSPCSPRRRADVGSHYNRSPVCIGSLNCHACMPGDGEVVGPAGMAPWPEWVGTRARLVATSATISIMCTCLVYKNGTCSTMTVWSADDLDVSCVVLQLHVY